METPVEDQHSGLSTSEEEAANTSDPPATDERGIMLLLNTNGTFYILVITEVPQNE